MPLVPSTTYNYSLENEELIRECFERIGIDGESLTPSQINSAKRSLNMLLLSWVSESTNLWMLSNAYLDLNSGQASYTLPSTITDVLQVSYRTFNRANTNGTPQTNTIATYDNGGGGVVANSFGGIAGISCIQVGINGNISYDYGYYVPPNAPVGYNPLTYLTKTITFIGIQSAVVANYTLLIEASQDTADWTTILEIPQQLYNVNPNNTGQVYWFDIPAPMAYRAYRVRETGGATLDLQQIYFCDNVFDRKMSKVSKDTYFAFPQKGMQGLPSVYYFDKQVSPVLNIWYPPKLYSAPIDARGAIPAVPAYIIGGVLRYSYINIMNDAGYYYNTVNIPNRMIPALIAGLTYMISVKYNNQMATELKAEYREIFDVATANDSENVDMQIQMDTSSYYR
jgi:hypothetical protein